MCYGKWTRYSVLIALCLLSAAQITMVLVRGWKYAFPQLSLGSSSRESKRAFVYVMGTSGICSQIMNSMAQAGMLLNRRFSHCCGNDITGSDTHRKLNTTVTHHNVTKYISVKRKTDLLLSMSQPTTNTDSMPLMEF